MDLSRPKRIVSAPSPSVREEIIMSASTTASSTTLTPNTWERLWRGSGINAVALIIAGYFVYGTQPGIGAPPDTVVAFYASHHTRILWAAVFFGLGGVLNLMWFAAAIRSTLREAGQGGWGSAATASSAAVGGVFLVLLAAGAALASSIAGSGNAAFVSGLNDRSEERRVGKECRSRW